MSNRISYKIITSILLLLLSFFALAKDSKQDLAYQATQAIFEYDKSAFQSAIESAAALAEQKAPAQLCLTEQQAKDFNTKLKIALYQHIFNIMVQSRAEILTEKEMKGLIAFYKAPLGQSLYKKYPIVLALSKVEPLEVVVQRVLSKEEREYSQKFSESDIGKTTSAKDVFIKMTAINRFKQSIHQVILDFTISYLNENIKA